MPTASKVLIVDDELIARESLEALLTGESYELHFASSGAEGLTKAAALRPDAILLDVMMPGMDGFEVCRQIRGNRTLEQIAIIMITALDDRSSRLAGLRAGADEFLSKPFDSVELKTRLQTIAHLGRFRRLLAERTRFEWLIEQAEEGFALLDEQGRIRYANPQARTYLGLGNQDLGQNFLTFVRQSYRLEPAAAWQAWSESGAFTAPCYLVRPETPTARAFWLHVDGLSDPDAKDLGHVVRLRDVTAQMTNYQDMRRFHTSVVHKLRTPLIAMHGSFTLLASYGAELSGHEVEEFARTALIGIERLKAEIDDVLQYINVPILALSGETVFFSAFAAHVLDLGTQLGIDQIQIDVEEKVLNEELPLTPQALDAILFELLENARKFHPSKTPHVEVEVSAADNKRIRMCIRDDGVHLSPEQIRWAWTPYLQGEKFFTGESPGMGLGLPLVATLVWQVGGDVALSNRTDMPGLEVSIELPLLEADPEFVF
jgi:CheY-like chemotaxis protein/nitrogen-specific signal transduction histidine kinase